MSKFIKMRKINKAGDVVKEIKIDIEADLNYKLLMKHVADVRNAETKEEHAKFYKRLQDFVYKLSIDTGSTPEEAREMVDLASKADNMFSKAKRTIQ
jgi:hypothetical protein